MFSKGWGNPTRYHNIYQLHNKPLNTPHVIKVHIDSSKTLNLKKSTSEKTNKPIIEQQISWFQSPVDYLLRKGEEKAEFSLFRVNKQSDTIAIQLPAANQQGYTQRMKIMGYFLLQNDIDFCCPVFPLYKNRKSQEQRKFGLTFQSVIDSPICFVAFLEEMRSLIQYLITEKEYKYIVISGMSMGGMFGNHLLGLIDVPGDVKLAFVSFMGYLNIFPGEQYAKIIEKNLNHKVKEFEECLKQVPFRIDMSKVKSAFGIVKEVGSYFERKFGLCRKFKSKTFKRSNIKKFVFVKAKYDEVISRQRTIHALKNVKKFCKLNGTDFEKIALECSHFGAFVKKDVVSEYRDIVLQCIYDIKM